MVGLPATRARLTGDPAVALQAVEVDVEAMPDAVLRDEIDLALGLDYSDAPLPPRRGLDVARLHREGFLLVLRPGPSWTPGPPRRSGPSRTTRTGSSRRRRRPSGGPSVRRAPGPASPRASGTWSPTPPSRSRWRRRDSGITLVTPLMLTMRATTAPTVALPGPSTRDVVALTRTAALDRAGVRAVRSALVEAFTF